MLDRLERSAGRRPLGPIVLGGSLALGVFLGGLVTFAAVLVILVGLFH